ncbi:3-deoxy-D-manno-octulosonic acid transferase [Roseibium sp. HPY-6]|uniref:3-deoxy-D-manno-octulosonic acid transferase n=1 Tax=Roseibium sp. HPY-6 TaxID=3229852 RepID=UPI00338E313B
MAEQRPVLLSLYRAAAQALSPLFHVLFWSRSRSGKEIPERKQERFGRSSIARPNGNLVWIHAASVGETTSALALIETLTAEGYTVLLTTVTVTASELAAKRLPDGAIHQFVPYDAPAPLKRFLDHWSPDLAMVVESEIWPCLFDELRCRKVPFVLLNGRLSDGSLRNWLRVPQTSRFVFDCLDLVLAQSQADAARFRKLGCTNVQVPGNLKFDASELTVDEATLLQLKTQIGERTIWLAALTHPGEDEIVFDAFSSLLRETPDLLLVLVPRHPVRAEEIKTEAEARDFSVVTRSSGDTVTSDTQVFLGDTLGEMGLYYRLAPVTFLGGSFTDVGGHNPVEAALAGSALATGPKVANARAVYKDFWSGGAAVRVSEPSMLAEQIGLLLMDTGRARTQAETARSLVEAGRGALGKSLDLLRPYLAKEKLRRPSEAYSDEGS